MNIDFARGRDAGLFVADWVAMLVNLYFRLNMHTLLCVTGFFFANSIFFCQIGLRPFPIFGVDKLPFKPCNLGVGGF